MKDNEQVALNMDSNEKKCIQNSKNKKLKITIFVIAVIVSLGTFSSFYRITVPFNSEHMYVKPAKCVLVGTSTKMMERAIGDGDSSSSLQLTVLNDDSTKPASYEKQETEVYYLRKKDLYKFRKLSNEDFDKLREKGSLIWNGKIDYEI